MTLRINDFEISISEYIAYLESNVSALRRRKASCNYARNFSRHLAIYLYSIYYHLAGSRHYLGTYLQRLLQFIQSVSSAIARYVIAGGQP